MDIENRLINHTAAVNSLRHQVPIAEHRERLAKLDAKGYAKDKAYFEGLLAFHQRHQSAAFLELLTCGYSHRRVMQIVRRLKC